jgi:hypothetical protein
MYNKFTSNSEVDTFTDLTTSSTEPVAPLAQGCHWFLALEAPDGDVGAFLFSTNFDGTTSKIGYTVGTATNAVVVQDPAGTFSITIGNYTPVYKLTVNLDTGDSTLATETGTATGDTKLKIIQIA